jgi:hypothetical protein
VVKQNGPPRRAVILSKFTVVSSFEESSVLEVDAGQTFFEGYTFSLGYTLVLEEWPRVGNGLDSYFSRADSFSPGYTLFSVRGMAQGGE